jgi:hypothetical protein
MPRHLTKTRPLLLLPVLLAGLVGAQAVHGQGKISLAASVDKSVITIGDLITYSVTVDREEQIEIVLPSLGSNLGGFEIRDYEVRPQVSRDGRLIDQVDYVISTFDVGEFEIPPIDIGYTEPPDTTRHVLKTESLKITVESVKPSEEGDIQDIRPPWEILFNWGPVLTYGSLALLVVLLVLGLIFYFRRMKRGEGLLPARLEPPRPPHELALEELQALRESDLLQNGEVKQYYSEVSEIIRRYIEGRYDVIALELTTDQLLAALKAIDLTGEIHAMFADLLRRSDLVKFAKMIPTDQANEEILDLAFAIVEKTKWEDPAAITEDEAGNHHDDTAAAEAEDEARAEEAAGPARPPMETQDGQESSSEKEERRD